ncbi:MAG: OsmC family protein [Hyphomicrobiales bacterium]
MPKSHSYTATVEWTGNKGSGTEGYRDYARSHDIVIEEKRVIAGSSDAAFMGDAGKHNPEDMLVASASACHMLWYLHLCSDNNIIVTAYRDCAVGDMDMNKNGSGQFSRIVLHPNVTVKDGCDIELATSLHEKAHKMCFIARSLNFPVENKPEITSE